VSLIAEDDVAFALFQETLPGFDAADTSDVPAEKARVNTRQNAKY